MKDTVCEYCAHYRQHYVLDEQSCTAVDCGHCVYPRLKHREPKQVACRYFEQRVGSCAYPNREHVIHFLTTEFLQYILSLDLPPEINK